MPSTKQSKPVNSNPLNKKPSGASVKDTKPSTDVKDTKPVVDTKPPRKGAPVGTSNEVFIELLPDERISRHKALEFVRSLGLGCSQARMATILEMKYGPAPERKRGGSSASNASKLEREQKRREAEAKALELVRAKRELAAKEGKAVEGYAPKVIVAVQDTIPEDEAPKDEDTK